jgi:hypothetical protein
MLGCKDPSSSQNGPTSQSLSPRRTFSSKITLIMMLFAKAFRQMQEPEDKIHDATHPLCGFGGRQIVALGKITMPVTFDFVHNTRTEQVVFDIVDMEYPYNAIIGRGTLIAFEAILHPAYLCIKIPSE